MKTLIDTSILVDYLRRYDPAEQFLDQLANRDLNISVITAMEIYRGSRAKEQFKLAERFIKKFNIIALNQTISQNALIILKKYQFTCFIDIPDALIAATAINKKYQLLTINLKDFDRIKGLIVKKPY